jgi:hypothetical protein
VRNTLKFSLNFECDEYKNCKSEQGFTFGSTAQKNILRKLEKAEDIIYSEIRGAFKPKHPKTNRKIIKDENRQKCNK